MAITFILYWKSISTLLKSHFSIKHKTRLDGCLYILKSIESTENH